MAEPLPEQEEARKDAEEILRWPGRNDALFPLARAYLALLAAYEDRSKAFERAAADCVRLEGEREPMLTALREMYGSYEALARMAAAGDTRPVEQAMNWDGPICARRIFGQDDHWLAPESVAEDEQHAHAEQEATWHAKLDEEDLEVLREAREHQEEKHGE